MAAALLTLLSAHVGAAEGRWLRDGRRLPERAGAGGAAAQGEARRPPARLTAEERRELRRDIQDARRTIYPRRRLTRCNGGDC